MILPDFIEEILKIQVFLSLSLKHFLNSLLLSLYFLLCVIQLRIRVLSYLHLFSLSDVSDHPLKVVEDIIELLLHFLSFPETLRLIDQVDIGRGGS